MRKLTEQEEEKRAFHYWRSEFGRRQRKMDEEFCAYFNKNLQRWFPEGQSILKSARQALCLTSYEVAERAKINQSALIRFEQREIAGNLTLASMQKIAEAMDCELLVGIRPKNGKYFSEVLWERLMPEAKKSIEPMVTVYRLALAVHTKSKVQRRRKTNSKSKYFVYFNLPSLASKS